MEFVAVSHIPTVEEARQRGGYAVPRSAHTISSLGQPPASGGRDVRGVSRLEERVAQRTAAAVCIFSELSNYPDPFSATDRSAIGGSPSTTIQFDLPQADFVRLTVSDVLGRVVAVLVEEERPAGSNRITFNASNLPSGVYLLSYRSWPYVETRRMLPPGGWLFVFGTAHEITLLILPLFPIF